MGMFFISVVGSIFVCKYKGFGVRGVCYIWRIFFLDRKSRLMEVLFEVIVILFIIIIDICRVMVVFL